MVLQRPLVAGIIVLVLWFALDRAWFQRSALGAWWQRRRVEPSLRQRLTVNPHDRDARFQLAEVLVHRKRFDQALALIAQNIEAGDEDDETLFVAGVAAFGSSGPDAVERGEAYMARARGKSAKFRSGAIELELGQGRLAHGLFAEAVDALRDAIKAQPGSVKAHVLLARALAKQGKAEDATKTRALAWTLYKESPPFKRRQVRAWGWRANPWSAVRYFGVVTIVVVGVIVVLPRLIPSQPQWQTEWQTVVEEDGFVVDVAVPAASRFRLTPRASTDAAPPHYLVRWDLDANEIVDWQRKMHLGDMWCRIKTHYPELGDAPAEFGYDAVDATTDEVFVVAPLVVSYSHATPDRSGVYAFEALLESRPPDDCVYERRYSGKHVVRTGVRNGELFIDERTQSP